VVSQFAATKLDRFTKVNHTGIRSNHMTTPPPQSRNSHQADDPLRVWGERRTTPDWDRFLAALIAYALRTADEEPEIEGGND
jgi:hypothetical protein